MPQTQGAAFTAQFSADAPLRGGLQTNAGRPRRADAAAPVPLARARTRTQVGAWRLRLFVVCLYLASVAAALLLAGTYVSVCQRKQQHVSLAAVSNPDGKLLCAFSLFETKGTR